MTSYLYLWFRDLKKRLRGEHELVAYGTGNLYRQRIGVGFLFYDFDNGTEQQYRSMIEQFAKWYGNNFFAWSTKHGIACVSMLPEDFGNIHKKFMVLKKQFPSDYLWDIPLFLRVSEKWDLEGNMVSPMPKLIFNPSGKDPWKFLSENCLPKKWYHTWD